jgi:hypothetical protein
MWVRSGKAISAKVLMVNANKDDEELILDTIDMTYNKGIGGVVFFPYRAFKRISAEKRKPYYTNNYYFRVNIVAL